MSELHRRLDELSREIRAYPTPIARCDEQLTALLEERAAVLAEIRQVERPATPCPPENTWINDGGFHAA
jgi:chorismate mutase